MASKHAFLLLVACATTSMVHGSQLETVLLQIEASVNKVAAVAEADYAQWICGDDLATKDETDCYFEMCKGACRVGLRCIRTISAWQVRDGALGFDRTLSIIFIP